MINQADTLFIIFSSALVMLMTPGLAFFYGGIVRRKNILSIVMQCFMAMCLLSLQWILLGYSLSFAPGNGFWGGFEWLGLSGVTFEPFAAYSETIPHQAFMFFQMMFAIITPALIIGAFAERMKFASYLIIMLLWATFVYDPICHWVWGEGGWLKELGVVDFAGGIVVHASAGIAALLICILIGKRNELNHTPSPHNLPFVALGTGLLWFGWFGFNGGSALGVNNAAVNALITTNTSAATAGLCWGLLEWVRNGKPTVFGVLTGTVAGLATITPACGFVTVGASVLIGITASVVCYIAVAVVKPYLDFDDSLDVFGVHGVGGILGTIAVGLFATTMVNAGGVNGLFYGNPKQLLLQLVAIAVTVVYTIVVTWIIYKLVDIFLGVRVEEEEEAMGLDLSEHHERAYTMLE